MAVIVDSAGKVVADAFVSAVGLRNPQLVRVVRALPMQSVEILKPRVAVPLTGATSTIIASIIASPQVYVHRMVGATRD